MLLAHQVEIVHYLLIKVPLVSPLSNSKLML